MPQIRAELEAVAGPLKGRTLELSEEETSIGREPSNQLAILDASVARKHARIRRDADEFTIQDLQSRNSTFVNGVPVTGKVHANAHELKIGNSVFLFVRPDAEPASSVSSSLEYGKDDTAGGSTIILRNQDALYLRDLDKLAPTDRMVRDLNALLRISKAVNWVRGLEALEKRVLESIFEVAPAERAAILLWDRGLEEYTSVFGWDRRSGLNPAVQVSRAVVSQVIEEGVAVVRNDLPAADASDLADNPATASIHGVLAVPLHVLHQWLAVIYHASINPNG